MRFIITLLITSSLSVLIGCASSAKLSQEVFPNQKTFVQLNDAPLEIKPTADVDENLFLLRALETTYERWPSDTVERGHLQNWLAQTRIKISRLRATIKIKSLDPDIGNLYDDCLEFLDVYETYLANVGAIDRDELRRTQDDLSKVFMHSFTSSFLTGQPVVGIVNGIVKGSEFKNSRDHDRRIALDAEARRMKAVLTNTTSIAEVLAERLTQQYGWKPGEAGFDGDTNRKINENLQRRPRDPFIKATYALTRVNDETPDNMMANARNLLVAARLVPEGRAYEGFRAEFVAAAADLSVKAAISQLPKSTYSLGPSKLAPEAVRISNTFLSLDPADAFGTGNALLARALAAANRYDEALTAVRTAIKKDKWRNHADFSVRAAKLLSLTNNPELVGNWLKKAYELGFNSIAIIRESEDFANYRKGKPEEYKQLTTVGFELDIKYDITLHEVTVKNVSPFELTNIHINVFVEKSDKAWRKELELASLLPGHEYTFDDALSLWLGRYDKATATLDSDQTVY